jgi:cell division protein FtsW
MTAPAVQHPGELRWETRLLVVLTITMTVFGVASMYSASSLQDGGFDFAMNQLTGALAGFLVLLIVSRFDYVRWRPLAWLILGVTLVLLLVPLLPFTLTISPVINGARRWVELGPVRFQPSELARFTIVLWAAALAAKKGAQVREFKKGVLPFLLVFGLVSLMILRQPSLSMATLVALLGVVVLFAAGAKAGQFVLMVLALVLIVISKVLGTGFRHERWLAFLDPVGSAQGAGLQVGQSLVGLGAGGLFGVGFGEGQQKLNYLPYAYSDFLFSAIGEEWGFLGSLVVILLYATFCWVGFRIARTARDPFGQFLAAGLTAGIGLTAFLHIAVTLGLMPTTGLPLPFMSFGRSNLMINLLSVGVIVSVGRMRGRGPARSGKAEGARSR